MSAAARPRLILHAGLHKTGSKSVQHWFARHAFALRDEKLLYPVAGRPFGADGQHNLAWQLSGDSRFDPQFGTIDALAAELAGFSGDVLISSEDFESLLPTPWKLRPLLRHPLLERYEIILLAYLRDQVSYGESLFLQMLRHGMVDDARLFFARLLRDGRIRYQDWLFSFDYEQLGREIAAQRHCRVLLRPYAKLVGGSTLSDLLTVIGRPLLARGETLDLRANRRDGLSRSLALFCGQRLARDVDWLETRLTSLFAASERAPSAHLAPLRHAALRRRFLPGNRNLGSLHGLEEGCLDAQASAPRGLDIETIFSARMIGVIDHWLSGDLDTGLVARLFGPATRDGIFYDPIRSDDVKAR